MIFTRELVERLALESGLLESSLSKPGNPMTDYGSVGDELQDFAKLLNEQLAVDTQRLLQWFRAVQDLNPKYLEPEDFALAERLKGEEKPAGVLPAG